MYIASKNIIYQDICQEILNRLDRLNIDSDNQYEVVKLDKNKEDIVEFCNREFVGDIIISDDMHKEVLEHPDFVKTNKIEPSWIRFTGYSGNIRNNRVFVGGEGADSFICDENRIYFFKKDRII